MARWADTDSDCQDTRQEVLIEESTVPVTLSANGCRVNMGRWEDPYSGEVFTDPSDLDIDHVVPLANAHISGGWAWNRQRREAYANDMGEAEHLLAVKNSLNRQKGDKSPDQWKPPREEDLSGVGVLRSQKHLTSSSPCVRLIRLRPRLRDEAALWETTLIEQCHKNSDPSLAKDTDQAQLSGPS